jgi:hypothetical protein
MKPPLPEYAVGAGGNGASFRQLENATLRSYIGFVGSDPFGLLSVFGRAQPPRTHRSLIAALCGIAPADCAAVRQFLQSTSRGFRRAA